MNHPPYSDIPEPPLAVAPTGTPLTSGAPSGARPNARRPLKARLAGVVRVALLAGAVSCTGLAIRVHTAHAAFGSALSSALGSVLGSEQTLSPLSSATGSREVSIVRLNGVQVRVRSSHEARSSSGLQDAFKKECPSASFFRGSVFNFGVATDNASRDVTGACLWSQPGVPVRSAFDLARATLAGTVGADWSATVLFSRDVQTGAVAESQALRFEVPIQALTGAFPASGDAPGVDPSFVLRPSGTRVLSVVLATEDGRNPANGPRELVFIYESPKTPDDALNAYAEAVLRSSPNLKVTNRGTLSRTYRDEHSYFSVVAADGPKGTLLTIVRL